MPPVDPNQTPPETPFYENSPDVRWDWGTPAHQDWSKWSNSASGQNDVNTAKDYWAARRAFTFGNTYQDVKNVFPNVVDQAHIDDQRLMSATRPLLQNESEPFPQLPIQVAKPMAAQYKHEWWQQGDEMPWSQAYAQGTPHTNFSNHPNIRTPVNESENLHQAYIRDTRDYQRAYKVNLASSNSFAQNGVPNLFWDSIQGRMPFQNNNAIRRFYATSSSPLSKFSMGKAHSYDSIPEQLATHDFYRQKYDPNFEIPDPKETIAGQAGYEPSPAYKEFVADRKFAGGFPHHVRPPMQRANLTQPLSRPTQILPRPTQKLPMGINEWGQQVERTQFPPNSNTQIRAPRPQPQAPAAPANQGGFLSRINPITAANVGSSLADYTARGIVHAINPAWDTRHVGQQMYDRIQQGSGAEYGSYPKPVTFGNVSNFMRGPAQQWAERSFPVANNRPVANQHKALFPQTMFHPAVPDINAAMRRSNWNDPPKPWYEQRWK